MSLRNLINLAFVFYLALILSCQRDLTPTGPQAGSLFFSSFEGESSLTKWEGISLDVKRGDTPSGGEEWAAYIAGGCLVPHAVRHLGPYAANIRVGLRCWGKNLTGSGSVSLQIRNVPEENIFVFIQEKEWTFYESENALLIPGGEKVRLQMNSGGFVAGGMLIDLLEVYMIN